MTVLQLNSIVFSIIVTHLLKNFFQNLDVTIPVFAYLLVKRNKNAATWDNEQTFSCKSKDSAVHA